MEEHTTGPSPVVAPVFTRMLVQFEHSAVVLQDASISIRDRAICPNRKQFQQSDTRTKGNIASRLGHRIQRERREHHKQAEKFEDGRTNGWAVETAWRPKLAS